MQQQERETRALMRDIANDAIDKGEWLKRDDAKKIKEQYALRPQVKYLIEHLIESGFLEPEHSDYGLDYLELRNAVFGRLNTSKIVLIKTGDSRLRQGHADQLYSEITRGIGRNTQKIIFYALESQQAPGIVGESLVYRDAFLTLAKEFDNALTNLTRELSNAKT